MAIFSNPNVSRAIGNVLITGSLIVLAIAGVWKLIHLPMFNIQRISLEPEQGEQLNYVSPSSIQKALSGQLSGNFFTLDLKKTQKLLEQSQWVRKVNITRLWPDGLLFLIEEHEPFALWNDEGLINTWGEAYLANRNDIKNVADLPQFYGPDGSEHLMVQRYAELVRWLAPLNLAIKNITLNERYAWQIILNNNLEIIIGRDPGAEETNPYAGDKSDHFAATIKRFVQIWPVLLKRIEGRVIKQVDLRYTKGLALTFEDSTPDSKDKEKK